MSEEITPRFFTFKPNVFSGRFFFYFGPWDRWQALRDWYLAHGLTDEHNFIWEGAWQADNGGMAGEPHPAHPIIVLPGVPHTPREIANLVHEIHHAVQRFTAALGIQTSRESEEVFAYLESTLTEAVLDYVWHGVAAPGLDVEDEKFC